jgi:two-component system sensor histidine kinase QseC
VTLVPASLQGRLLALVLGLVGAVWLAAALQLALDARHELDELLDGHLAQAAALLVAQQSGEPPDADAGEGPGLGIDDGPALHRYSPGVAFQVFHEGRLALRSANAPLAPMAERAAQAGSGFEDARIEGVTWRVFTTYGAERDVRVYVGEQLGSRDAILRAVLRSTLQPMALALPLLALAAWWAVRQGLRPLRRLGRLLAERAPQSTAPVALAGAPAEMRPLIAALDGLFERIGALMESERRFTADAAHELRTPIAAIRAQAQAALGANAAADVHHALQATLAGCDRAARLVEQLLTLSRLEAGAAPPTQTVDLAALVQRELAELVPRALDKGQTVTVDAAPGCSVGGDATLLGVLVRNLVDNAIRYSPAGASVQLSLGAAPGERGGPRLCVEDSGAGLAAAEQQRLGERFFRVLGSGESGSGLGWSIVRRIAAAHRARIEVGRSEQLGGLRVVVEWPRC